MAFVTSAGTLDKRDEATRLMLADRADFIGAIRLPGGKNGAFKDNAGTEVTTDIIFLQKHENKLISDISDVPDWVHIGETADGLPINKYFEQHPEMVLGTVVEGNKLYGSGTMVVAEDGFDLKTALHEAVGKLSAEISHEKGRDVYSKTAQGLSVKIPSDLRNFSFFMHDDKVFFKTNAVFAEQRFDKKNAQFGRYKAFIELRDITRELIEAQELDKPDSVIKDLQAKYLPCIKARISAYSQQMRDSRFYPEMPLKIQVLVYFHRIVHTYTAAAEYDTAFTSVSVGYLPYLVIMCLVYFGEQNKCDLSPFFTVYSSEPM